MNQFIKPPTSFWVVAGFSLLWNLMGVAAFAADLMITPEAIEMLPEGQRELYKSMPSWPKIFYGIATIGGALASVGLLMKKSWCIPVFIISLVAVLIQQGYTLLFTDAIELMGTTVMIFPLVIITICFFLVWYAKKAHGNSWIA